MIEPFYFGEEPNLLFGVYHPPQTGACSKVGVILCYPVGQEYIRSHRAFLRLARLLSSTGFHVLRFDFYGSGDSAGDGEQASVGRWIADISTAVDELRGGCDVGRICLIGLRLGGTLAAIAGAERGDIDGLVLWDPVVEGRAYLKELKSLHKEWLRGSFAKSQPRFGREQHDEVLGFALTDSVQKQLQELDLLTLGRKPANNVLVIEGSQTASLKPLIEKHLAGTEVHLCYKYVPSPEVWVKKKDEQGRGLVPTEVLQFIVSWISKVFS